MPSLVTANDIIDFACVDVAPRISFIPVSDISERGLRNVITRVGIIWALDNWAILFINQETYDFFVSTIEVMRIQEVIECLLARGTICVGSSIYIDIHAVCQCLERWILLVLRMRGGRDTQCENHGDSEQTIPASAMRQG